MRRFLAIVVLALFVVPAWADSEGPNNPATAVDDATVGTVVWLNPTNVFTSNDSRARAPLDDLDPQSHYLKATNFSFTLTNCTSVDGITVEIERREGNLDLPVVSDALVKIVRSGVIGGTDKAAAGAWPTTDAIKSYGGVADLWGLSWTCGQITASNFGVVISAGCDCNFEEIEDALIDHVRITVTFTAAQPKLLITRQEIREWEPTVMPVHKQVSMPLVDLTRFVCAIKPLIVVEPNRNKSWQWMAILRPTYTDGKKWSYLYLHRKRYEKAAQDCNMFHRRLKRLRR